MEKDTLTKRPAVQTRVEALRSCRHLFWIAGLALAIILVISCGGDRGASVATPKDMAPNFSFTLYQGEVELGAEALELSDLQGRPTVLNFWAGLCPEISESKDVTQGLERYCSVSKFMVAGATNFLAGARWEAEGMGLQTLSQGHGTGHSTEVIAPADYPVAGPAIKDFLAASRPVRFWPLEVSLSPVRQCGQVKMAVIDSERQNT